VTKTTTTQGVSPALSLASTVPDPSKNMEPTTTTATPRGDPSEMGVCFCLAGCRIFVVVRGENPARQMAVARPGRTAALGGDPPSS
jgi:hypothetical protein